jgi:hypothetical protein
VEVARELGLHLNAKQSASGMGWTAKWMRDFDDLGLLAWLFGKLDWHIQYQVSADGYLVKLFIHEVQLADLLIKFSATTGVRCRTAAYVACRCVCCLPLPDPPAAACVPHHCVCLMMSISRSTRRACASYCCPCLAALTGPRWYASNEHLLFTDCFVQTLGVRVPYVREFKPDTPEAHIRDLPFVRPDEDSPLAGTSITVKYKASASLRAVEEDLGSIRLPTECTLLDALSHYFLVL